MIAVAIRGGGYETEWAGNFEIGGDATHHGFAIAATKVHTEILKYFEQHTDLLSKKLKFWVVGYSRAGATANLVSAWLSSKPVTGNLKRKTSMPILLKRRSQQHSPKIIGIMITFTTS